MLPLRHQLLPCAHTFIKEMLTFHLFGKHCKALAAITTVCLTILLIALVLIILLAYLMINGTMRLALLLWYRKRFGGVLGMDSYFECTKSHITTVYIVEHSGTFAELYSSIKLSCGRLYESHYKFSSTVKSFCGFYYFLKNEVFLRDVIFVEDGTDVLTKQQFIDYLEKHCFNGWEDNKLWNVIVFNKPITWNNDSSAYYPIVIRYNHCIGDGIALSVHAQKYFLNDARSERFEKIIRNSIKSGSFHKTTNIGSVLLMGPKLDYSTLTSVKPTQNLAVFIEKEPKYLDLISYIRKQLQCSFTDVITTAALASLTNYLKLEGVEPRNLIVYNTTRPVNDNFELIWQAKNLKNGFTLDAFNLPWTKEETMLANYKIIKDILRNGRTSATGQIIFLLSNILSYLHPSLVTKFSRYNSIGTSLGISNIPFADYGKIGNSPVKDTFSFVNHFEYTKFLLVITSYDGRLQVTLTTKKHMKTSQKELQMILQNIFMNIDNLYEEVKLL